MSITDIARARDYRVQSSPATRTAKLIVSRRRVHSVLGERLSVGALAGAPPRRGGGNESGNENGLHRCECCGLRGVTRSRRLGFWRKNSCLRTPHYNSRRGRPAQRGGGARRSGRHAGGFPPLSCCPSSLLLLRTQVAAGARTSCQYYPLERTLQYAAVSTVG